MPGESELVEWARLLEGWRPHYFRSLAEFYAASNKAAESLKEFDAAMSALQTINQKWMAEAEEEKANGDITKNLSNRNNEINEARIAAQQLTRLPTLNAHFQSIRGWKWLAQALVGDFENAMRPNNPGLGGGISRTGPLVRFIAAIVPFMTGEHPTRDSIAKQLQAVRKALAVS